MKRFLSILLFTFPATFFCFIQAQIVVPGLVDKHPDPMSVCIPYAEAGYNLSRSARLADPAIAAMVAAINEDTLRTTLQEMGNWGSRFLMNDNKKEIATSLVNKFLSYGYTDVRLDSFYLVIQNWMGLSDSSWQYNVVCTLPGSSAPDEIYIVGGHWDSICLPDPVNDAPGVDDNGTAVAATLEIARLMKLYNYQPESTIRFTLFAAEELGLFGSRDAASKARLAGTDIRYMLNMDMISNNPDNIQQVKIYKYYGMEWAAIVAAEATELYTDLSAVFPQNLVNTGSDSFPYWLEGFPSAYFEEIVFSPNWHIPSDTLGNCNVPYLKKVTGGALATLVEQQRLPYPQNLRAGSAADQITLSWKPTSNAFVKGFNVYRSESSGKEFQKINQAPVADSVYFDTPDLIHKQYYYVVTTVNDSLQESAFSNEVIGARFSFSDSLLVLANVKGNSTTPDSVMEFYRTVLDTIPYKWIDLNASQKINLTQLSRYRSIMWLSNSAEYEPMTDELYNSVSSFIDNGGNLLFAGFVPGKYWLGGSIPYPLFIPGDVLFHRIFKVDSIDFKMNSMMYRAVPALPGYDTLRVDSLKYMDKNFIGQIYNVEVFAPDSTASVIYRFDSHFTSTTSFGKMKNRPVGIEYMGADHKSILLSFPLIYLDTADARSFMHYVMTNKFGHPVGIDNLKYETAFRMQVFPNPVADACNISFTLDKPGRVRLTISTLEMQVVTIYDKYMEAGDHRLSFMMDALAPGLYTIVLQQGNQFASRKMIRLE